MPYLQRFRKLTLYVSIFPIVTARIGIHPMFVHGWYRSLYGDGTFAHYWHGEIGMWSGAGPMSAVDIGVVSAAFRVKNILSRRMKAGLMMTTARYRPSKG
ncbi:hypothetical protein CRM93_13490 [Acetobacter fabarum]|uniref:Uncharacterized protein n=1 Tax=Acetobacter fabarum TaxID=483199 RepID=A0A269XVJ0_9PROT|nr:hypothetical protein B8X00_12755 [Acetobacter fabarum]PEN22138.1 hypothetical protein CRM93_13490 [Acetobacter fabarum]